MCTSFTDSQNQCSQERPRCNTCTKSKRECAGYYKDRVFILDQRNDQGINQSNGRKKRSETTTESDLMGFSKVTAPDTITAKQILSPSTVQARSLESSVPTEFAFTSIWVSSSPSTRALYRQQILGEFLFMYLPKTKTNLEDRTLKQRNAVSGNWLSLLPSLSNPTTALEAAILAISTAKLGRVHNDLSLVRESLKFYIQAIWELQRALFDHKTMYKDGTLAACLLLIMYEVLECPDHTINAWTRHLKGCATLFESRGPKAYASEFGHQLFLSLRQVEVRFLQ